MRESRTYGSVRGALSNERPYRDQLRGATKVGWRPAVGRLEVPVLFDELGPKAPHVAARETRKARRQRSGGDAGGVER
jgi:hypothetical protein